VAQTRQHSALNSKHLHNANAIMKNANALFAIICSVNMGCAAWAQTAAPAASDSAASSSVIVDDATGLKFTPPAGLTATRGAPRRGQDVVITVRTESGVPKAKNRDGSLCAIAFANGPANAKLSQAEINALSRKEEWRNVVKATFELIFTIAPLESITQKGVGGVRFTANPKPEFPDQDVHASMAMFETPRGRTSVVCVTDRASATSAEPIFAAIRAGVEFPR
jgi:hypothetical protein